jgi:hypothetical protein
MFPNQDGLRKSGTSVPSTMSQPFLQAGHDIDSTHSFAAAFASEFAH